MAIIYKVEKQGSNQFDDLQRDVFAAEGRGSVGEILFGKKKAPAKKKKAPAVHQRPSGNTTGPKFKPNWGAGGMTTGSGTVIDTNQVIDPNATPGNIGGITTGPGGQPGGNPVPVNNNPPVSQPYVDPGNGCGGTSTDPCPGGNPTTQPSPTPVDNSGGGGGDTSGGGSGGGCSQDTGQVDANGNPILTDGNGNYCDGNGNPTDAQGNPLGSSTGTGGGATKTATTQASCTMDYIIAGLIGAGLGFWGSHKWKKNVYVGTGIGIGAGLFGAWLYCNKYHSIGKTMTTAPSASPSVAPTSVASSSTDQSGANSPDNSPDASVNLDQISQDATSFNGENAKKDSIVIVKPKTPAIKHISVHKQMVILPTDTRAFA